MPENESLPTTGKHGIRAKLNGLEHRGMEGKGAHLCRVMLSKADLSRNSHTEYTLSRLSREAVGQAGPRLICSASTAHPNQSLRQHTQLRELVFKALAGLASTDSGTGWI